MSNKPRVLLIGAGHYAKKSYIPILNKNYQNSLKGIIELNSKKRETKNIARKIKAKTLFFKPMKNEYILNNIQKKKLHSFIKKNKINAAIISTNPQSHKTYIQTLLKWGIHILTDKPITTNNNASINRNQAKKVSIDYQNITETYKEALQKYPNLNCSIATQRRYNPVIQKMLTTIKEISKKTNCPVTNIYLSKSDGDWRTPKEIETIAYHGFTKGIGVCSHSGYHIFDLLNQISKTFPKEKTINNIEIVSDFSRPLDYLEQINQKDYIKMFGQITSIKKAPLGERDANIQISLYSKDKKITQVNLSIIHNGISSRDWYKNKRDFYLKNGRQKLELHRIDIGPFASIIFESNEESSRLCIKKGATLGQETEFYEIKKDKNGLKTDSARIALVEEFIQSITKNINLNKLKSNILDHKFSVDLMSNIYISAAKRYIKTNPLVRYNIK